VEPGSAGRRPWLGRGAVVKLLLAKDGVGPNAARNRVRGLGGGFRRSSCAASGMAGGRDLVSTFAVVHLQPLCSFAWGSSTDFQTNSRDDFTRFPV
jgi:hypothetical protein